ncbi:MAG: hypothetical protein GY867_12970 [bacterium]|nr:hypothetical protein [bacterium]
MENTQKKGMSKGCLVGIIIAAVLVVIAAIGVALIYFYMDDIGKFGVVTLADGVKAGVAENPPEGVDTVRVNAMIDAFVEKVNAAEEDNLVTLSAFMQTVQTVVSDREVDAEEVELTMDAMIDVYPELDTIWRPYVPVDAETEDSLVTE